MKPAKLRAPYRYERIRDLADAWLHEAHRWFKIGNYRAGLWCDVRGRRLERLRHRAQAEYFSYVDRIQENYRRAMAEREARLSSSQVRP